jgi:hypothetical protein
MKILHWLVYLPLSLLMDAAAFLAAPFAALARKDGSLPRWARWFETEDNDCYGDEGHWARWFPEGRPLTRELDASLKGYIAAVAWLWRNRAYYFNRHVIGAKVTPTTPVLVTGNELVSNRPYVPGVVLRRTPDGYWQLYVIKGWGKNRLVRINLGWKLWGDPKHPNFGQFVCSVNPWAKRG